ncbi:branched-chain amino acid transport system substrate-binding protein [Mobilisporobacter senegalensis]|uniref:Branched-chain amino acid transport system substrate-binding protein n=1 Tax=Mobilisporobacter senegalensis TaxID=1329262 RepID=A0A3N1XPQ9_9FIRM|nr:ABC transporter substrate-binding protein [Mobilisporobacter senegalensis]ROR28606.1 branched-chain amino acid transport system substrate-binding protein [Mobilisporobacter senegalensis]
MKLKKLLSLTLIASTVVAGTVGCAKKDAGGDVFMIGGSGPLTGSAASYGISVKQGAELAIKEINDAGGVNGIKLELNFLDDEAKAQPAIAAYNKVMDEGADAILGTVTSDSMLAITELTNEDGILQITPSASVQEATKYENAFRVCFTDPLQGVTMADYAVETLGYKNLAVLYNVADNYSKGVATAFIEEAKAKGATIVAEESFVTDDVDFNTQLTTIKAAGADALFLPVYYQDAAYIINQANQQGITLPLLGSDGWDGVLGQLEDASLANGGIFLSPFAANDPAENVQKFVKAYQEEFDAVPDQFAADGYDGVYIIKAAIEKAGSTDSAKLIAAMTEIEVDGVTGKMTFTPEGEPNKSAKLIEIVNGEYQLKQ